MWNHRPTAEELLQARLRRGWSPTPSPLKEGGTVLGYASCVFPASHSRIVSDADTEASE